jgi:hemerythrin
MNFHWNNKYSVGVSSIDEQHKPIIEILNELHKPTDQINMVSVAQKSLDYTKRHFAFEEGLMLDNKYDLYAEHKAQHDKFINMILAFINNNQSEGAKATARMVLIRWFIDHITSNVMDKKLGVYLNGIGIK